MSPLATGSIDWEKFKILYERKLKEDEEEKELKEAFRVLDNNKKGVIPVDDLRWILKSLGMVFSHDVRTVLMFFVEF